MWLYVFNFGENSSEIHMQIGKRLVLLEKYWCQSLGFPFASAELEFLR